MLKQPEKIKPLKNRLFINHLIIAVLGATLIVINLFLFFWLKQIAVRLYDTSFPLVQVSKATQIHLQKSQLAIQNWMNFDDENLISDNKKIWDKLLPDDLQKLQLLSENSNINELKKIFPDVANKLSDLKVWQWRIEQAAHKPGNTRSVYLVSSQLNPLFEHIASHLKYLIAKDANKELINLLYYFIRSHGYFVSFVKENSQQDYVLSKAYLTKAKQSLEQVASQHLPYNSLQAISISQLLVQFKKYILTREKVSNIKIQISDNLSIYWLKEKLIPILNAINLDLGQYIATGKHLRQADTNQMLNMLAIITYFSLASIFLLVLGSWYLSRNSARKIIRPINMLIGATDKLAKGDLDENLDLVGSVEIRSLIESFNRMRQQRLQAEKRITVLVETAADPIIQITNDGTITLCNSATGKVLGYNINELIGSNVSMLMSEPFRSNQNSFFSRYLSMNEQITSTSEEIEVMTKSGDLIPMLLSISATMLDGQRVYTGILHDLTHSKQQAHEKEAILRQLEQSQKLESIGKLAGGIAHDFNNLLSGILGYAENLQKKLENRPDLLKKVNVIITSSKRAADLTGQLLGFARKGKYEMIDINISDVLHDTERLLEPIFQKSILCKYNLEPNLWMVQGDITQISQVFLNIALNARDAMPDGGEITFTTENVCATQDYCSARKMLTPGNYVLVSIQDTGLGMSPEVQSQIFEPFYTTKDFGKGTGLGLSMVYGIVKNHQGEISVYSELGHGSVFNLYFPAKNINASETAVSHKTVQDKRLTPNIKGVLVIDDEEVIRELVVLFLEDCDEEIKVFTAINGEDGLSVFRENQAEIDVIILDLIMPKKDGIQAFKDIREISPDVAILFASGFSENDEVAVLRQTDSVEFIHKPYERSKLIKMLNKLCAS